MSEWRCVWCVHRRAWMIVGCPVCPGECAEKAADAREAMKVVQDVEEAFPSPRQEVRGPIVATGFDLDHFASTFNLKRHMAESDQELRDRILAALGRRGSISGPP